MSQGGSQASDGKNKRSIWRLFNFKSAEASTRRGTAFFLGWVVLAIIGLIVTLVCLNAILQSVSNTPGVTPEIQDVINQSMLLIWFTLAFQGLFVLMLIGAIGAALNNRFLGPLIPIRRQVRALIAGDYSNEVRLRSYDEVRFKELAKELNELTEVLKRSTPPKA